MILLVLLALCVLLLCAALFVPVRYRVTVETKDEIRVRCQISWLLRVVYIVQETLESGIRIRIFGIPLDRLKKIPAFFRRTAESLCYRFAEIDKERFGSIEDVTR